MPHEQRQSNSAQLSEIKTLLVSTNKEIEQVHGRIKRVESVVLGDEEKGIIGLAEKFRALETDSKASDRKRATVFVCIGWIAAFLGQYVLTEILPKKPLSIEVEKPRRSENDREMLSVQK